MNKENLILKNYSSIPNYFIDNIVRSISASESVVMLCILRKTIGFQKLEDQISLSQLVEMSGITKKTCINCLKSLEKQNFIFINRSTKEKVDLTNVIKINIKKLFTGGSVEITQGWCNQSNLCSVKITHTKENKQNKKDFSFQKKEEYPEIPIIEFLNNEKRIHFDIIDIEAQS